jgi:PRTRC genetic system protein A
MSLTDEAILKTFPLLAVPASGCPAPAAASGTRYLVAHNGLWREISLPWVLVRHQIASSVLQLPYGALCAEVEFRCGPVPLALLGAFGGEARAHAPQEVAGAFLWNAASRRWKYASRPVRCAGDSHVAYDEVRLAQDEHLVVDVHSHGHHPAFFSAQDDRDDAGAMKVSLVLGNLDQPRRSCRMRLCMAGLVRDAHLNERGELQVAP